MVQSPGPKIEEVTPVRLAFYKGKGTWIDKLIRWGTGTPYSHVELIGPDGKGWSASPRERKVRKKAINFDSGNWDIVEVHWKSLTITADRINPMMGRKYDYVGIFLNHVISVMRPRPDKWFCSELIAYSLGLQNPHTFSPGSLYNVEKYMTNFQKVANAPKET